MITATDALAGEVTNTAAAHGTADGRTVSSPRVQATILIGAPRLSLSKRVATPGPHFRGQRVRFEFEVENTGPEELHSLVVEDSRVARVVCDTTRLAPGESTQCHGSVLVNVADERAGRVTNFAQAFGIDVHGFSFRSPFATASFPVAVRVTVPVTG